MSFLLSTFLELEKNCPLLQNNNGFLENQSYKTLVDRRDRWKALLLGDRLIERVSPPNIDNPDTARIIKADAERIFFSESHRQQLVRFFTRLCDRLKGDYSQPLAYISGAPFLFFNKYSIFTIVFG